MKFNCDNYTLDPEISDESSIISKHTEKPLKSLTILFRTAADVELPDILHSEDGKEWKVKNSSYSYTDGNPLKTYTWKIMEVEKLNIKKIIINDLEFELYKYTEEINDGLVIDAIIETSSENWLKIKDLIIRSEYYPVKREGISDQKKEMRFGKVIWSETGDQIKFRFTLFDKIYDEHHPYIGLFEPEFPIVRRKLLETSNTMNKLLDLLLDKDLISNEENDRIRSVNDEDMDLMVYFKVDDLDEFLKMTGSWDQFDKI